METEREGEYGTLYPFEIEYRDEDPGAPVMRWRCWAYSAQDAEERFYQGPDSDGWIPLRIAQMTAKPRASWKWTRLERLAA